MAYFGHLLTQVADIGVGIADSWGKFKYVGISHSVFNQKLGSAVQRHPRIIELPTFGHSENNAGPKDWGAFTRN